MFHQTVPVSRILITLSIIDDIVLKLTYNDVESMLKVFVI